jgi:hypothetical protein
MQYRQTTLVHLGEGDTLTIERDRTGMVGATVRDATGNTVARVEFIGRLEQLDPVALAAVDRDGTEVESVTCPRCGMPTTRDLCVQAVGA